MGVKTGMQQEQKHCQQCQQSPVEHPINQQVTKKTAADKKQVRQQMAAQVDGAGILQPQDPLQPNQRRLKSNPVIPVRITPRRIIIAQRIVHGAGPNNPLPILIQRHPVIIQNRQPRHEKQGVQHRRARDGQPLDCRPPPAGTPEHLEHGFNRHRPDYSIGKPHSRACYVIPSR